MRSKAAASFTSSAIPSIITASLPLSFATVHAELAARFCPFRDLRPVEKENASSSQTPQTGITCGRDLPESRPERIVASQNVRQRFMFLATQFHESRPLPSPAPTIP